MDEEENVDEKYFNLKVKEAIYEHGFDSGGEDVLSQDFNDNPNLKPT